MTEQQKQQVLSLQKEGYSVREIAAEMGLPKTAVGNVIKGIHDGGVGYVDTEGDRLSKAGNTVNAELGRLELELKHERAMKEIELREKEMGLQRKQLELQEIQTQNERDRLRSEEQRLESLADQENARRERREEKFVERYDDLLGELMQNCQDSTWTVAELDELARRADKLQTDVLRHCNRHDFDEDVLAIYHNLAEIGDLAEGLKNGRTSAKSKVDVNLTDKERESLKDRLSILSFADLVSDEEDNEDEDEDEEAERTPIRALEALSGTEEDTSEEESNDNGGLIKVIGGLALAGILLTRK